MEFEVKYWPIKLDTDVEVGWDWGTLYSLSKFKELMSTGSVSPSQPGEDDNITSSEEETEYEQELAESRRDYGY
jgi:hypothetical protein